jgi:hypothetical protein
MSKGRFRDGELYRLLPAVIQHRDGLTGGPLKKVLEDFGIEADRLEEKIQDAYANFFVETCGSQELAYIADLIGYRPIIAQQPGNNGQPEVTAADCDSPPKLALRRDVAKTIWARRRKGTPEVLGAIVRFITGWHTVVFENNREVVATPSIRFAGAPRSQGTPDFRKLVGRNRMDQGPGLIPRVATARRVDTSGARGRWHPLDVVVEAWSTRAGLHKSAALGPSPNGPFLIIRHGGDDQPLYAPANESAEATRIIESARPIYLSDFVDKDPASLKRQIYGMEKVICLYQAGPNGKPLEICMDDVMFGSVPDLTVADVWIIDPERGRIQPPKNNRNPVVLRCYLACNSKVSNEVNETVRVRLNEHIPMESRTGVVLRS